MLDDRGVTDAIIIDIECTGDAAAQDHPKPSPTSVHMEKLSSMRLVSGAKRLGTTAVRLHVCVIMNNVQGGKEDARGFETKWKRAT